jgi:hypothetical protein
MTVWMVERKLAAGAGWIAYSAHNTEAEAEAAADKCTGFLVRVVPVRTRPATLSHYRVY